MLLYTCINVYTPSNALHIYAYVHSVLFYFGLAIEFQQCSDIDSVISCINKELRLRRYAKDVISCLRFVVLYAIFVSMSVMILCGLLIITDSPLIVKIQFMLISMTMLVEIYMYTWPADFMTDMSVNASRSVYHVLWYEHTVRMQKNILSVLMYQKPVVLSVTYVIPQLSLRYFCSYLSNAFSIFASLRAVVEGDQR
ncbi:PREDICTED: uncharacterized protein LOC108551338 [Eufriesea mexicana]|uniref:uncharacterized protein LOC108551338 n=1 Tax=Eufriesea mexicana TaxID=516756 RepID=UPI00083BADCE|nr:PREDICTED: uncharacterized protein LOC108551338 [Eufriesea mexicana]